MSGKILITRPELQGQAFAKEVAGLGCETALAPMLDIKALEFDVVNLSMYQAIIFTSANGVRAFCRQVDSRDLAIYVVGAQTEEAAQKAGFKEIYSATGDADDLVAMISNEAPDIARPLLYVRGVHVSKKLDQMLGEVGFSVDELIAYEAQATDKIPADVVQFIQSEDVQAVVFFSRRTAENFVQRADECGIGGSLASIKALCISQSVLECVQAFSWRETHICDQPDRAGMMDLIRRVCVMPEDKPRDVTMSDDDQKEQKMSAAKKSKGKAIENAVEVIERFGGIRPMAKKIDVAVTTVQGWKKRDTIPAGRRAKILEAAEEYKVDLSDILAGAPEISVEASDAGPANENLQNEKSDDAPAQSVEAENISESVSEDIESPEEDEPIILSQAASVDAAADASASVPSSSSGLRAERPSLDNRLRQTEKNAIKKSTWINFALLVAGLIAVGAFLLFGGQDKANEQRLGTLEQDVDELRGDVDAVRGEQSFLKTLIPENLDERIQNIQDQAVEAQQKVNQAIATAGAISSDVLGPEGGTIQERAAKLQAYAESSPQIQALAEKLMGMSNSTIGNEKLDQAVTQLNYALGSAGEGLGVSEALDQARAATPALDETFEAVPQNELKAAALLLGMTQLRSALNRDNEAFAEDLTLLKNIVSKDEATPENDALLQALDKLAPRAQEGVLTPKGLTNEFRTIAGEAVVESLKGEDVSLGDKVTARFSELLQVEKDGELVNGTPTQETLSRAESLLEGGDIAAAIEAVQTLDGPAAAAAQPWIDEAKATLLAESLKDFLSGGLGSAAAGGEILPRESKFIRNEKAGINILVPGKSLGSDSYR